MALTRQDRIALGLAAGFALVLPALLLGTGRAARPREAVPPARTVVAPPVAAIGAVYERALFAPAEGGGDAPADAPALVGIAGRLNRDAVALVRLATGGSRSLAIGESVDGWRLESLAIDAAFFTRGRERVRVAVESDAAAPSDQ